MIVQKKRFIDPRLISLVFVNFTLWRPISEITSLFYLYILKSVEYYQVYNERHKKENSCRDSAVIIVIQSKGRNIAYSIFIKFFCTFCKG